ncbi:cytochrome c oxidase copper chaperone [Fusarium beomiforme]|uniref:Cytochrome c oxidase copper chaperone n=1 Tax=Fusarium beomiforme TaxID=44412 RepID=A0A9P5AE43_9HYPO|nr:cytochrome c oxidase copper chaperone [Fusarium beomiforme]
MDAAQTTISSPVSAAANVASPSTTATSKPKPCCVCKDEKAKRDECMLFSNAKDPAADCKSLIDQYRSCMSGFGYQV